MIIYVCRDVGVQIAPIPVTVTMGVPAHPRMELVSVRLDIEELHARGVSMKPSLVAFNGFSKAVFLSYI